MGFGWNKFEEVDFEEEEYYFLESNFEKFFVLVIKLLLFRVKKIFVKLFFKIV